MALPYWLSVQSGKFSETHEYTEWNGSLTVVGINQGVKEDAELPARTRPR